MTGIVIFCIYSIILYFIYLVATKNNKQKDINTLIFSGGKRSSITLIPGIFNSWLWTTSVLGAAEASLVYGFYGGISFAIGTGIGVCAAMFIILKFRSLMNGSIFITDFIEVRFSKNTEFIFYAASILLVIYIIIEQSVGLSSVFSTFFGISFKKTAFFSVLAVFVFVMFAGMRGAILNDIFSFVIIFITLIFLTNVVFDSANTDVFLENIHNTGIFTGTSMYDVIFSSSICIKYGLSAMIRGFAQIMLDPAYYIKAHIAKDKKTFITSFISGGIVLWVPFVVISSMLFGYVLTNMGTDYQSSLGMGKILSAAFTDSQLMPYAKAVFGIFFILIAFTSIINSIIGIWSINSIKIYPKYANAEASESQCLKYGILITFLISLVCSLIAISLEEVSLFTIDIFSGIFFSTPAGVIVCGIFGRKKYGELSVYSVIFGVVIGFVTWLYFESSDSGYFYATAASFVSPMIFLFITSRIRNNDDFNFESLKFKA